MSENSSMESIETASTVESEPQSTPTDEKSVLEAPTTPIPSDSDEVQEVKKEETTEREEEEQGDEEQLTIDEHDNEDEEEKEEEQPQDHSATSQDSTTQQLETRENENEIKNFEEHPEETSMEFDTKPTPQEASIDRDNDDVPEMNGNSSLVLDDDASCSSSTSSSSSHNLVIDHPLADEKPAEKSTPPPDIGLEIAPEERSLKRKLSTCENGPQHKQIHLDSEFAKSPSPLTSSKNDDSHPKESLPTGPLNEGVVRKEPASAVAPKENPENHHIIQETYIPPPQPTDPSPYQQYVQSFGTNLPIPKLSFDCFKCNSANFETFIELRDHQKICLLKDIAAKLHTVPASSPDASKQPTPSETPTVRKKRFFLCSSCGTYHENWNLFLHIREIHNRHVCLYCIRLFPTAEKLSLHLEIKHDLEQNHFNSEEKLRSVSKGDGNSRFLMCCTCQHVFSEHEHFSDHICSEYMQPCSLCNQKGRHANNCKANPEKRPKVKKKRNPPPLEPAKKITQQPPRLLPGTTSLLPATPVPICDNQNSLVLSSLHPPVPQHPHEYAKQNGFSEPAGKLPEDTNYHSDDSTNMVIDETCNNNNYSNETGGVNPFKALDEHERQQEEERKALESKPALPPDRAPVNVVEPKPLIVPKIKLRVPKEFQKSVESEISSSDTDVDGEEEEVEEEHEIEEGEGQQQPNGEISLDNNANLSKEDDESEENDTCSMDEKDNTQEWAESNFNLDRILKEIEKTKLDIQRTKELLEPMNILKKSTVEEEPENKTSPRPDEGKSPQVDSISEHETTDNQEQSGWVTPKPGMYSPTPLPSPESSWSLASPTYEATEKSPTSAAQVGSERENAENIEKEAEESKYQKIEPVEPAEMDTSGEVDVESLNDQETMDVDEKPKSPKLNELHEEPSARMDDFTPIVSENPQKQETDESTVAKEEHDEHIDVVQEKIVPSDGIEMAGEETHITDLLLDRPLERFDIVEFIRLCVKSVFTLCLYCHHARRIAVNGHSLVLHLLAQHRFAATVDSITAEELLPSTIVSKLKSFLPELEQHYFNLESYCTIPPKEKNVIVCDERVFECFQCRFVTRLHKDLYLHNRKMHLRTAIICFMCRTNFFSFSEILCHICPGMPNKVDVFDIKFRCCLCEVDAIPSPFRLMVHLRKKHYACDVCLEDCREQGRLSSHVWKHKLHHLCYRCGIAYRNKMDITKHLFWKHGTESIICKRCLQKRWRHVYHFCVPPPSFVCEVCNVCFSKATYLKVHKRIHTGDFRYPCTEDDCGQKFVSRKLLLKHSATHAPPEINVPETTDETEPTCQHEENDEKPENITPVEVKDSQESIDENKDISKEEDKKPAKCPEATSRRKKKKNRNKESLEDLNLIAPNLSESDSSDESDNDRPKTEDNDSLVPNVVLSPPSEEDKEEEKNANKDTGKIMDIWENFKSYQASQQQSKADEEDNDSYSESNYPTPILHVAYSDHDYCAMYKIRPRNPVEKQDVEQPAVDERKEVPPTSDHEADDKDNSASRAKTISPSKKKRKSTGSGSSSSDSSSGSDSSCSCGSNCSCSSSGSSSSSSSSDEDSDSSTSEGRRRIAAKKEERANKSRKDTENALKTSISESIDVVTEDKDPEPVPIEPKKPEQNLQTNFFIESDLETAESETDEEFYDEHPQKLASEALAQIRNQLQAKMQLSPSQQNYGIVENSRPSTPSLPEDVVKEKKVKLKKKKRDRKSSNKTQALPPIKLNLSINKHVTAPNEQPAGHSTSMQVPEVDLIPPYDLIASPNVAEPPIAQQPLSVPILQNNSAVKPVPVPFFHTRMSEGSSCSDADNSLKRSKRARRPNKFYGYTSDDENTPGTPLIIGTRTFKPQPPPQLTWRKEDLPAPSKSILLNKQPRSPRTSKTPAGSGGPMKRWVHTKSGLKRKQHKLPPIPTLKIRPPKMSIVPPAPASLPPQPTAAPPVNNNSFFPSQTDSDDSDSSDDRMTKLTASNTLAAPTWNHAQQPMHTPTPAQLPPAPTTVPIVQPPPAPSPQPSMLNRKIPPALLSNPDFATIQYFKRNNIRYPIRPPAGARQPREGESVYCYCRCPYDEVSEMIACDGENCLIEWFHFECVGIMVAPQGKWFCAECRPKYSNELYPNL